MPDANVLIVDDEPEIGRYVATVAQACLYTAEAVSDADAFRSRFVEWLPSHIVLDLQMPDADGIELLGFLADQRCEASIVIMSGFDQKTLESARVFGLERGLKIVATVSKPIRAAELKALLEGVRNATPPGLDAAALEHALEHGEFWLAFQPKVALNTPASAGAPVMRQLGFEALVRWGHTTRGQINPDQFIPLVESLGSMDRLTDLVIELGLSQLSRWSANGIDTTLAINVSASNLRSSRFTDRLVARCRAAGVRPDQIVIELTESATMQDPVLAMETLTRLRLKGVRLSIDDFGTGYSSLVQLQRLPFSELKIDRAFVRECDTNAQSRIIVKTIIDLAHNLGLETVAEGVESASVLRVLQEFGCDAVQGFHVGKPMPAAQAESWYRAASTHGVLAPDGTLRRDMQVT